MKRTICHRSFGAFLCTGLLAICAAPSMGAPLPQAPAARDTGPSVRKGAEAAADSAALPAFQAVGLFGDLAVLDPARLLSVAKYVEPDPDFSSVVFVTGIARHPTSGALYVVGNDLSNSYLGQVDFTTGAQTTLGVIEGEIVVDIAFDGAGTLYGLTDNAQGATPHALLRIDTATASATVVKILDAHGGTGGTFQYGAIAWNATDGSLYYADRNNDTPQRHLFIDRLAPGTFAQTPVVTASFGAAPYAMAFTAGKLWLSTNAFFYSIDPSNIAGGFANEGSVLFPSPDGELVYRASGLVPAALPCVPGPAAACLHHRFKVEVSYDATPGNGSGPGNVVLESGDSVKFSFFDPENIEVIVKILNACSPPFTKWWVFAGGLTNVGVSIKVTDTRTGAVKTYASAKGQLFQPFADTGAFACP